MAATMTAARRPPAATSRSSRRRRRRRVHLLQSATATVAVLAFVALLSGGRRGVPAVADAAKDKPALADPDYSIYLTADQILARTKAVAQAHPRTVRRAVARAYDGDYGANVTVMVVEPGGLRDAPQMTEAQVAERAAVAAQVRSLAADGLPPTPAAEAGNGTDGAGGAVPSGVWVPPLRSDDDRVRVLMDFGQHGREFITSEVGVRLLEVLAAAGSDAPDRAAADAALAAAAGCPVGSPRLRRLRAVLDRLSLVLLPLENEGGRARVEAGDRCERKNGRGVDPNRNWPYDWGRKEPDYDPSEEFPGRAPGSEPETRVVRALSQELKPHAWINVHSGMQALFTAYDHVARVPQGDGARAALALLHRLDARACKGKCVVGSGGKSVGYLAHGTATDHMYTSAGVPLAFTWEIYGDEAADFDDCFRMFNPLGKEAFEAVVSAWVKASLSALELLPTHPAVAPLFAVGGKDARLFAVDAGKEPEETAEAVEAELKAAALQAESAKAEQEEEEAKRKKSKDKEKEEQQQQQGGEGNKPKKKKKRMESGGLPPASDAQEEEDEQQAAAAAAAAGGGGIKQGSGGSVDAPSSSSAAEEGASSSPALPRRMGPQRQQLLVSSGAGGGGGGASGASGALGISASGAGARLFAAAPLLVLLGGALGAAGVAIARQRQRQRAAAAAGGAYLPTALVDLDEGGFGFGPVVAPAGGRRLGGLSLVGVVGRRP